VDEQLQIAVGHAFRKADRCVELRHKGDGNRPYGPGGWRFPVVLEKLNYTAPWVSS